MPNSKEIKLKNYLNVMKNSFKDKRTNIPIIYLLSLTFSVLSIFIALISKNLVDNLLNLNIDGIFNIVIISIGAYLFGSLVGYFSSYFQKYVIDRFKMDLQLSFYDNIQKSHYSFILNISSSDVYYRMFTDIGVLVDFYINLIVNVPVKVLIFISTLIIMSFWSYKLTLIILVFIILQYVSMFLFRKPIKKRSEDALASEQLLYFKINENINTEEICRSLALEELRLIDIKKYFNKKRKSSLRYTQINLIYSAVLNFASQIINMILLLLGVNMVMKNEITIGILMGISILSTYLSQPINDIFTTIMSYQPTKISYKRYVDFNEQIDLGRYEGKNEFVNGDIVIRDLSFSYDNTNLFNNFNCTIPKGDIALIKGGNGSGKTTLMRLLSRYIIQCSGEILINNQDIRLIDFEDYRKHVITLDSNSAILNGSLRFNISTGLNVDDDKLQDIIKMCGLSNVLDKLGNDFESELGKGKILLSKGEVQKIAIARIIIRDPDIIIFDEPFANMDNKSIADIKNLLININRSGKTIIIICHDNIMDESASKIINEDIDAKQKADNTAYIIFITTIIAYNCSYYFFIFCAKRDTNTFQ